MSSIDLGVANSRLNRCKTCGGYGDFCIEQLCGGIDVYSSIYRVTVRCIGLNKCGKRIESEPCGYSSIKNEIDKLVRQWNQENDISSEIDIKLIGFDDDQKSFVCILLYLAGYKFTPEDLSKYIQHSTINIRETFESMTQEQKSKAFIMIGQALGYLSEGGPKA